MSNRAILTFLLFFLTVSCKVTEKNITGTYRLKEVPKTKLLLHKDKTFSFTKNFAQPGPAFFPDSTEMNFQTAGHWQLTKNGLLLLNSFPAITTGNHATIADSVQYNSSITSFSFWDSYGDPVPIRFIKFLPAKIKFHRGNSISFFIEDFNPKDTMEFHFYGYAPVKWPGTTPQDQLQNNTHRITLYEPVRPGYLTNITLTADKKKLVSTDKSFALVKSK